MNPARPVVVVDAMRWIRGLLPVVVAIAWMQPQTADARAGGGGGYSGGGYSGGGYSGGGWSSGGYHGSGGRGRPASPMATLIAVVLIVVITSLKNQGGSRTPSGQQATIRRERRRQTEQWMRQQLQTVRQSDPHFRVNTFLERVRRAFLEIQTGWSRMDLGKVRPFLSDGVYQQFDLQLRMMAARGEQNIMEQVRVHRARLMAVAATPQFHALSVEIEASAIDYRINVASGRTVPGTRRSETFTEYWTFLRRPGGTDRTVASPVGEASPDDDIRLGSLEGYCPQCRAELHIVDVARCEACGCWVNSGEHDWVLVKITQESEWKLPAEHRQMAEEVLDTDPTFAAVAVEDAAAVMFWRLRAAEFFRRRDPALPILHPGDEAEAKLDHRIAAGTVYLEPAIGDVDLIRVQAMPGHDRALVKVRWSGTEARYGESAASPRPLDDQRAYIHFFTLRRESGQQSTPRQAFAASTCTQCGGSIAESREGNCAFCGAVLNDGRHGWVLVSISTLVEEWGSLSDALHERAQMTAGAGIYSLVDPARQPHRDHAVDLAVIAHAIFTDHELTEAEKAAFLSLCEETGLPRAEAVELLRTASRDNAELDVPPDPRASIEVLGEIVRGVLIDRRLTKDERRLLQSYAKRAGLSTYDVNRAIKRERAALHQAARQRT